MSISKMCHEDHSLFYRKKLESMKLNPPLPVPPLPDNTRYLVVIRNLTKNIPEKWLATTVKNEGKLRIIHTFIFATFQRKIAGSEERLCRPMNEFSKVCEFIKGN